MVLRASFVSGKIPVKPLCVKGLGNLWDIDKFLDLKQKKINKVSYL